MLILRTSALQMRMDGKSRSHFTNNDYMVNYRTTTLFIPKHDLIQILGDALTKSGNNFIYHFFGNGASVPGTIVCTYV